ncbi:hypothetical protein BH24ACT15_BH24ACT15_30420 [soil metagenome]
MNTAATVTVTFGTLIAIEVALMGVIRRRHEARLQALWDGHEARCRARDALSRRRLIGLYRVARDLGFRFDGPAEAEMHRLIDVDRAETAEQIERLERQI